MRKTKKNQAVHGAVYGAVAAALHYAVYGAVNEPVYWAVYTAVDDAAGRFVNWAAHRAVYDAVDADPDHPALQDFLLEMRRT